MSRVSSNTMGLFIENGGRLNTNNALHSIELIVDNLLALCYVVHSRLNLDGYECRSYTNTAFMREFGL